MTPPNAQELTEPTKTYISTDPHFDILGNAKSIIVSTAATPQEHFVIRGNAKSLLVSTAVTPPTPLDILHYVEDDNT